VTAPQTVPLDRNSRFNPRQDRPTLSKNLWDATLDDLRIPPKGWKRAFVPAQLIWHLKRQNVAVISLDFDLGIGVPSGIAVLN